VAAQISWSRVSSGAGQGPRCRWTSTTSAIPSGASVCLTTASSLVWFVASSERTLAPRNNQRVGDPGSCQPDLAAHFASADCFVFPSRTETFGGVILEALASGLPVASVPAPGAVDLIQEGVNGAIDDQPIARWNQRRAPESASMIPVSVSPASKQARFADVEDPQARRI
jgi:glycosyltransferase involved in cell wall biosynthesis